MNTLLQAGSAPFLRTGSVHVSSKSGGVFFCDASAFCAAMTDAEALLHISSASFDALLDVAEANFAFPYVSEGKKFLNVLELAIELDAHASLSFLLDCIDVEANGVQGAINGLFLRSLAAIGADGQSMSLISTTLILASHKNGIDFNAVPASSEPCVFSLNAFVTTTRISLPLFLLDLVFQKVPLAYEALLRLYGFAGSRWRIDDVVGQGDALLHFASRCGDCTLITYLLDIGANPQSLNDGGISPLELAMMNDNKAAAQLLHASVAKRAMSAVIGSLHG